MDPDGNHPVIAGAIIGGAISGTAAIIKGKSFTEVIAATTGGAGDYDPSDLELASVTPRRLNEEGTRLNVFGKHPGYRKVSKERS